MKGVVFLDLLNPYKTQFCSVVNTEQHLWGISVGLVCRVLFVISPLWILLFFTVGFQMYPLVVLTCEESARLCQAQVRGRVCGGLMGTRLWMDHLGRVHELVHDTEDEDWSSRKEPFQLILDKVSMRNREWELWDFSWWLKVDDGRWLRIKTKLDYVMKHVTHHTTAYMSGTHCLRTPLVNHRS